MTNAQPTSLASEIISYVRSRTRLGSNPPNAAFQTTQMLVALNDVNEWFWYWPAANSMNPWKISRKRKLFTTVASTTNSGVITAGDTTFTLADSTDWINPASADVQAGYIRNSDGAYVLFTYELLTGAILSAVSDIDIDIADGQTVCKFLPLPDDYGRPRQLKVDGSREYKFIDNEFDDLPPSGCYMTHFLKSTNGFTKFFLVLPDRMQGDQTVRFQYVRKPTSISSGTIRVDAPDGIARWALIEKMKAYVWGERGEPEEQAKCNATAEVLMQQFASVQMNEDAGPNQDATFDF